jgi:hypothetical protein
MNFGKESTKLDPICVFKKSISPRNFKKSTIKQQVFLMKTNWVSKDFSGGENISL